MTNLPVGNATNLIPMLFSNPAEAGDEALGRVETPEDCAGEFVATFDAVDGLHATAKLMIAPRSMNTQSLRMRRFIEGSRLSAFGCRALESLRRIRGVCPPRRSRAPRG